MKDSNLARLLRTGTDQTEHEPADVTLPIELKLVREMSRPLKSRARSRARKIVADNGIYRPFRTF